MWRIIEAKIGSPSASTYQTSPWTQVPCSPPSRTQCSKTVARLSPLCRQALAQPGGGIRLA